MKKSTKKKKAPAGNGGARNARPWYAPRPRWYADDVEPGLLMRREPQRYVVRDVARCNSTYQAEQLAAALNRAERYARWRNEDLERLRDACRVAEERRAALRKLVDALTVPPEKLADLDRAVEAARRVLGDEPTFAPGGQEVAR